VVTVHPDRRPGPLGFTVHRFQFNRRIETGDIADVDWVIGWDMDGYRLAGRPDIRFAAYVHGQLADEARFERGWVRLSMLVQSRAERASVRRAARVLTVSQYSRHRIAELYGRPEGEIVIVPPAFDANRWARALAETSSVPDERRPTILFVGRMYPRKDLGTLIRAMVEVRSALPPARLVAIGDGPERRRWTRLAAALGLGDGVQFRGQVDFDTLAQAYAGCHVFCLPSRQEGFGIVLLEAMAAGKPIVACAGTAAAELLDGDTLGALVPPGDPRVLANRLLQLLTDPARRARHGAGGPATAARYAPPVVAQQFIDALEHHPHRGVT
jgi:glycosyltransferase involved in cell wall biosynthesis